ncbi:hypothetical protein CPC16_010082 [Podila verticillata]|nr:hypothetical protein CPC16_010082 [Podila verticillata]KFH72900.1 hypothetical protein MVEG_00125 [Podila verticillata NRRL 6337]
MQTPQQQQQFQQQIQQQQRTAMQAGRMPNARHGSFEMGQPSQSWAFGSGPMPGMNQSRPPMSGFPSMMQPTMLQQQQHQHSQHHSHQEIPDMSDFPALGSANNASSNTGLSSASYASTAGTSSNPNAASSANGMPQEFSIEDDFPALPGARPNSSAGLGNGRSFNQSLSQQQMQQMHHQQQQHRSQQQQHMMSQDGLSGYSPMSNPTSGAQMQSLQLQQQLANDMMFQQQQSLAQQQQLLQRQLGQVSSAQSQLNGGSSSQLGLSPSGSTGEFSKPTNSYATKAGNGSGILASLNNLPTSSSLNSGATSTPTSGPNGASRQGSSGAVGSSSGQGATTTTSSAPGGLLSAASKTVASAGSAGSSALDEHDRFGLFGMLGVIRMTDQDITTLALGSDLTTLGLSLNSPDPLYNTFASPWFESSLSAGAEVDFHVPSCYNVQPPPPPQGKLSSVLDETLFYMFYSMPRDALQDAAAMELYNRHWRYHKELRLWLTKDQSSEQTKTPTFERGSYIFFDPNSWEKVKKEFIVMYDSLEERRQPPPPALLPNGVATSSGGSSVGGDQSLATPSSGILSGSSSHLEMLGHSGLLNHLNMSSNDPVNMKQQQLGSFQQQQQHKQMINMGQSHFGANGVGSSN